ncbi:MAG: serine/threonine-protein phosphatase [Gemmatimonadetes bacterium]|nr:serine/threonine-protein phosphatase [Gemmatimonadota bacterium]
MAASPPRPEPPADDRPSGRDIDVFGVTHPGLKRDENQDAYLIASLHHAMVVHDGSLDDDEPATMTSTRRGMLFLVADGVGGGVGGRAASTAALRAASRYVTEAMDYYARSEPGTEKAFIDHMLMAVERTHQDVLEAGERDEGTRGMASTLTMVTIVWPRAHLVHVGDSRCYRLRDGALECLTKDQTMAQLALDSGDMSVEEAEQSRLRHVLWSALGAQQLAPDSYHTDVRRADRMLLCTDGLTKHVSDAEIAAWMAKPVDSKTICRGLLDLVLERGASDNVTLIMGQMSPMAR